MRYFVDDNGVYLGGTDGEALSENEVPHAPSDARQRWNGNDYDDVSQADHDARRDQQANFNNLDPVFVAFIQCVNDGSIVPSAGVPDAQINAAIRVKM